MKTDKLRVGFIGAGNRGSSLLTNMFSVENVIVTAICDPNPDAVKTNVDRCNEKYGDVCTGYSDYKDLLDSGKVDAVVIASTWLTHVRIACEAMKRGIYVGMEVGPAGSIDECRKLVETYEETGTHLFLLENCCWGQNELFILNLVRKGILGELVHLAGAYQHDCREIYLREYDNMDKPYCERIYHKLRNMEGYPTHELVPLGKYIGINSKNRFLTLSAASSKAVGFQKLYKEQRGTDYPERINQGDVVSTLIRCANGETISLTYDTSLPRPYSRGLRIQGSNGIWMEDNRSIYIEGRSPKDKWESDAEYMTEFEHPLWTKYRESEIQGGHGGMDYLMLCAFADFASRNARPPIDTYDAATYISIACLVEDSLSMGGALVTVPDFTDGKWIKKREYEKDNLYDINI